MRFTSAYYLLLIYVTITVKPLIPTIADAFSHQFNAIQHLSVVHAKYGSNHLQKELAGTDSCNDKGNRETSLRLQDEVPVHMPISAGSGNEAYALTSVETHLLLLQAPSSVYILYEGKPPKFSW